MSESGKDISFWTLVGLGSLLAAIYAGATFVRFFTRFPLGVATVQLLIGMLLPILLIGAGFWLSETDHPPERRWKVVMWSFGGLATLTAVTGWGLYLRLFIPSASGGLAEILILNAQAGAVAGFVVGAYDARADGRESELQELNTRLELALVGSDTGVWEWNTKTDELFWDEACEKLFGYGPGEFTGEYEGFVDRVHPEDIDEVEEQIDQTIETGEEYQADFRIEPLDGDQRWIQSRGVVYYDEDGEAERMLGIQTDITEHKEREHELERYEAFINSSSDEIMHISESGELLYESPVPEMPLGYEPGEQVGDNVFEYVHPEDRELALEAFDSLLDDPEAVVDRVTLRLKDAEGEYTWVELRGTDQTNTEVGGVVISLREINDRVEREQELQETKRKLELSNEQLEEFAYVASHDLREPLRMVSSYLELLADEYGEELDEEADEYIEFAVDGAERMREMIEALLEYSRVESRSQEFTGVDTEEVLEDVLRDLELLVDREKAVVTHDSLPTVEGDRNQVAQLFQNLIKNGIEHTGDEPPEIHVGVNEHREEHEFFVEDNGVGIPEEEQETVFELFKQGSHREGGTGIGLTVCSRIVKRHGGEMRVESEVGGGSTFYFTIPKQAYI